MKHIATWIRESDAAHFERVFSHYPKLKLWNARTDPIPKQVHGLLLTGGFDISQRFLRQPVPNPNLIEKPDPARDAWEFRIIVKALRRQLPLLAICRGLQVLNVTLSGTLKLDIPNHSRPEGETMHPLRHAKGATFQFPKVNSSHHQCIDKLGYGLEVEAWCAADDVIEQARLRGYPFGVAVQYHPERDPSYKPLFDAFVAQVQK